MHTDCEILIALSILPEKHPVPESTFTAVQGTEGAWGQVERGGGGGEGVEEREVLRTERAACRL